MPADIDNMPVTAVNTMKRNFLGLFRMLYGIGEWWRQATVIKLVGTKPSACIYRILPELISQSILLFHCQAQLPITSRIPVTARQSGSNQSAQTENVNYFTSDLPYLSDTSNVAE